MKKIGVFRDRAKLIVPVHCIYCSVVSIAKTIMTLQYPQMAWHRLSSHHCFSTTPASRQNTPKQTHPHKTHHFAECRAPPANLLTCRPQYRWFSDTQKQVFYRRQPYRMKPNPRPLHQMSGRGFSLLPMLRQLPRQRQLLDQSSSIVLLFPHYLRCRLVGRPYLTRHRVSFACVMAAHAEQLIARRRAPAGLMRSAAVHAPSIAAAISGAILSSPTQVSSPR